jgi:hypothetical protein
LPLVTFRKRHLSAALGTELFLLLLVASVSAAAVLLGSEVAAPYHERTFIDLSFSALPRYTLLSPGRGFVAYSLSLLLAESRYALDA